MEVCNAREGVQTLKVSVCKSGTFLQLQLLHLHATKKKKLTEWILQRKHLTLLGSVSGTRERPSPS
jgi:hypothetical protein